MSDYIADPKWNGTLERTVATQLDYWLITATRKPLTFRLAEDSTDKMVESIVSGVRASSEIAVLKASLAKAVNDIHAIDGKLMLAQKKLAETEGERDELRREMATHYKPGH